MDPISNHPAGTELNLFIQRALEKKIHLNEAILGPKSMFLQIGLKVAVKVVNKLVFKAGLVDFWPLGGTRTS